MLHTLDCLHSNSTGELTLICTGMATAPIAIDLETGTSVTLHPAWAHTDLARFGIASVSRAVHGCVGNAWWGDLPMDRDRTEARLALVIDNVVQNFTARWPEPEPEPAPKPKRVRRQGGYGHALAGPAGGDRRQHPQPADGSPPVPGPPTL